MGLAARNQVVNNSFQYRSSSQPNNIDKKRKKEKRKEKKRKKKQKKKTKTVKEMIAFVLRVG